MTRSRAVSGLASVWVFTLLWGCGPAVSPGPPDTGSRDAGGGDAGGADAGSSDAGMPDAGVPDAGMADSGATDGGVADAGSSDAGDLTLFVQPSLSGPTVLVPIATHLPVPNDQFVYILWQANPLAGSNGLLVPISGFNSAGLTGFDGGQPIGFNPSATVTSEAEALGDTVGVYLNTADIVGFSAPGDTDGKMMITPQYRFSPGTQHKVFANPNAGLHFTLRLQVPTAVDENVSKCHTYANLDILFVDTVSGVQVSYGVGLFRHQLGGNPAAFGTGIDPVTGNSLFNPALIDAGAPYVTLNAGSATMHTGPWTGMDAFDFTVTTQNFQNGLTQLAAALDGGFSTSPGNYLLLEVHLNAEVEHDGCVNPAAVQLGWSMQGLVARWHPGP